MASESSACVVKQEGVPPKPSEAPGGCGGPSTPTYGQHANDTGATAQGVSPTDNAVSAASPAGSVSRGIDGVPDGATYVGDTANWVDPCRADKPRFGAHGKGRLTYSNGDVYEGNFREGKRDGQGTLWFKSGEREGDVFTGTFKAGRAHGYGEYTCKGGSRWYRGDTTDGADVNSEGCVPGAHTTPGHPGLQKSDDGYFKGEFAKDERHGSGTLYDRHPDEPGAQVLRKGEWRNDVEYEPPEQQKRPKDFSIFHKIGDGIVKEKDGRYMVKVVENATPSQVAKEIGKSVEEILAQNPKLHGAVGNSKLKLGTPVYLPKQAAAAYESDYQAACSRAEAADEAKRAREQAAQGEEQEEAEAAGDGEAGETLVRTDARVPRSLAELKPVREKPIGGQRVNWSEDEMEVFEVAIQGGEATVEAIQPYLPNRTDKAIKYKLDQMLKLVPTREEQLNAARASWEEKLEGLKVLKKEAATERDRALAKGGFLLDTIPIAEAEMAR